ncbi:MAG: drug/metabolite exporter YedA [Steroidobacteraceae bacterium]|nr:drug/metabolite exporter YedA [Steroidobacteraceae bacterium]
MSTVSPRTADARFPAEQVAQARAGAKASLWLVVACLGAVYIVWGTTYYALKVGVQSTGPFFLIGTRFLVAGGLLTAWLLARGQALPTLREWRGATVLAVLMLVIGMGCTTAAERTVSSGAAVALISVMPLMMAVWSGLLEKWPGRGEWLAVGAGLVGTLVMITGKDLRASPGGTALIFIATLSWSLGTVLSRRLVVPKGAMGFAAEMIAGGIIAMLISAAFGEQWSLPATADVWWAWGYLVVFGSLVAFSAYRYLVEHVSPMLASTYAYVNPPVALFVGYWLGNETFSPNVLLGLPIVLGAVGWHTWTQLRALKRGP